MKITKHLVLLQYPKAGEPGWHSHPITAEDSEKFVALDGPSGGYPYPADIDSAHDFKSIHKAEAYRGHFAQFSIREVAVTYEF